MRHLPLLVLLSLFNFYSFAQEEQTKIKKLSLKAVSLQFGILSIDQRTFESFQKFNKLAPNSKLLKNDFSGFESGSGHYSQKNGGAFSMKTFFSLNSSREKVRKLSPQLEIGISYNEVEVIKALISRTSTFRIDSSSFSSYPADSTSIETYFLSYSQDQVYLDLGFRVSTNTKNRWKLYGGVSGSVGLALNPIVAILYVERTSFDRGSTPSSGSGPSILGPKIESEIYSNKTEVVYMLSASLGADFLLTQKEESLKYWHLFIESRPNMIYQSANRTNSKANFSNIVGMGVKCEFNN